MLSFEYCALRFCKPMLRCLFDFACLTTQNRVYCGCGGPEKAEPEGIFDEGEGGGERKAKVEKKEMKRKVEMPGLQMCIRGWDRGLTQRFQKIYVPLFLAIIIFLFECLKKPYDIDNF